MSSGSYSNGNFSAAPYRNQVYVGRNSHFGLPGQVAPWTSKHRAWQAYQQNPALFAMTPAQQVAAEQFFITNSEYIEETVSAGYAQVEARLFRNRLNVLTGVRYEKTTDEAQRAFSEIRARNPNANYGVWAAQLQQNLFRTDAAYLSARASSKLAPSASFAHASPNSRRTTTTTSPLPESPASDSRGQPDPLRRAVVDDEPSGQGGGAKVEIGEKAPSGASLQEFPQILHIQRDRLARLLAASP